MIKIILSVLIYISPYILSAVATSATITASSCSYTDISSAVTSSSSGDVIAIPAGTCNWSESELSLGKSVTLRGSSPTTTVLSNAQIHLGSTNSRITNIGFVSGYITKFSSSGTAWRIDHNRFTHSSREVAIQITGYTASSHPTGLIDNNYFVYGAIIVYGYPDTEAGMANASALWALGNDFGSANNVVYIEDNTFTTGTSASYIDCMDANYGGRFVFRYNTLVNTHTEFHGIQSTSNRGVPRFEIYGNNYTTQNATYFAILGRSGTGVIWGNTISGSYTNHIAFDNQTSTRYGDYSCTPNAPYGYLDNVPCDGNNDRDGNRSGMEGYPCRDQIGRGRDVPQWSVGAAYNQALSPIYIWSNTNNTPTITNESPLTSCIASNASRHLVHLKNNREWFSQVSSFNGTTGIGVGLLSERPATCSSLPVSTGLDGEQGGGVGYWATDTNTLYRCSSDNIWTTHYTPYTYPHPLRNEHFSPGSGKRVGGGSSGGTFR